MWYDTFIACYEGVQGGYPVVAGTRTPIRTIVILCRDVYPNDRDEVQRSLPHLTSRQIDAALAYYNDHPDLVDADIKRQEQALHEFLLTQ